MYSQLIVLSDPVKGREDEYNDWYTWVHIRDVMRLSPSVVAVQRFRRAAQQLMPVAGSKYPQAYMAIYENTDPVRMTADHAPIFTDDLPISSAYSYETDTCCAYFDTTLERTTVPGQHPKGDLIVEWIEAAADSPSFANWYANVRFPALMQLPGVFRGMVSKASAHQMDPGGNRAAFTAVYRTRDLEGTLRAWAKVEAASPAPWQPGDVTVGCFTPLIDRVTRIEVMEPDETSRETARRKREAMGDRVHRGIPAQAA